MHLWVLFKISYTLWAWLPLFVHRHKQWWCTSFFPTCKSPPKLAAILSLDVLILLSCSDIILLYPLIARSGIMLSRPRSCGLGLLKATYLLGFPKNNCNPGSSCLAPFAIAHQVPWAGKCEQLNKMIVHVSGGKTDHRGCISGRVLFIKTKRTNMWLL